MKTEFKNKSFNKKILYNSGVARDAIAFDLIENETRLKHSYSDLIFGFASGCMHQVILFLIFSLYFSVTISVDFFRNMLNRFRASSKINAYPDSENLIAG